jgi:UDP-3-O-[3-hydroxymyristoyl] N-acetylglucosamine deacetylase
MGPASLNRLTIARAVERCGIGIFGGEECRVLLTPAEPKSGIVFVVPDGEVSARTKNAETGARYSELRQDRARVSVVEHLLSAVAVSGITDLRVICTAPELPFFDGSALEWMQAIDEAGLQNLGVPMEVLRPAEPVIVSDGNQVVVVVGSSRPAIGYLLEYPSVGSQWAYVEVTPEAYRAEIAPARSFITKREFEEARATGCFERATADTGILFDEGKPHTPLRFHNEPARHKILDMIGDFSLCGAPLRALVIGVRSGHRLNQRALREVLKHTQASLPAS